MTRTLVFDPGLPRVRCGTRHSVVSKEAERCNNATGRGDPEFAPRRKKRSLSNACHGSLFFSLDLLTTPRQRHAHTDEQGDAEESFLCRASRQPLCVFFIVSAVVPLGKSAMRRARRNLVWNGHTAPGPVRSPCQSANRRSSRGSPPSPRTTPLSSSSRQQPPFTLVLHRVLFLVARFCALALPSSRYLFSSKNQTFVTSA